MCLEKQVGFPEWGQPSVPMSSGYSPEGTTLFLWPLGMHIT